MFIDGIDVGEFKDFFTFRSFVDSFNVFGVFGLAFGVFGLVFGAFGLTSTSLLFRYIAFFNFFKSEICFAPRFFAVVLVLVIPVATIFCVSRSEYSADVRLPSSGSVDIELANEIGVSAAVFENIDSVDMEIGVCGVPIMENSSESSVFLASRSPTIAPTAVKH
jgi:hypothetical protein